MKDSLTVKELASLAGISVRTLHYYDEIGLLIPEYKTENNYRRYSLKSVERLWTILFLKELDIPLAKIRIILDGAADNCNDILLDHRRLLLDKRKQLDAIITSLDKTITKGFELNMMKAFDKKEYEAHKKEAIEKYGDVAKQTYEKTDSYSEEKMKGLNSEMNNIFKALSLNMSKGPDDAIVHDLVAELQSHITKNYYECTDEIFKGLGSLYVCDQRFTDNIDSIREGLAQFTKDAIDSYLLSKLDK